MWVAVYLSVFVAAQALASQFLIYDVMRRRAVTLERAFDIVRLTHMPVVLALTALIGLPLLYIIILLRRVSWTEMILQRPLRPKVVLGYAAIGMALQFLFVLICSLPPLARFAGGSTESALLFGAAPTPRNILSILLVLGIVTPIYEEVILQGLIFREMAAALPLRWAVILQAALFALYHGGGPVAAVLLFSLALFMCRRYAADLSIWTPCAIHCGFSIGGVLLQALYLLA
jgi:membrane protease YdiL (CAAX protease family)